MEPEEKGTSLGEIIAAGIGGLIMSAICLYQTSPLGIIIFCVLFAGVTFFCILGITVWSSTDRIEQRIRKRLRRKGYQSEMTEGVLFVTKNENQFRVHLENSSNWRIKALYILYEFGDDRFNKVSMDGWCRASNSINVNNTATTFVTLDDHFCCCYQSAIGNSKDFMREFDRACQYINGVMDDYGKLCPYLERDYPNKEESKTSIGFKQN